MKATVKKRKQQVPRVPYQKCKENSTMSGRGGRQGCGGRGRFGRGPNKRSSPSYKKKSLNDYMYYLGSARQASDYEKTTEYLINHIKKSFNFGNDIGTALEELQEHDMTPHHPKLEFSTSTDTDKKAAEDEQYKIEFKAEYDGYMKRKQALETNMMKAYAFPWEQCAKAMQNKIEA